MTLNEEIYPVLAEMGIGKNDGLGLLLMIYYNVKPSFVPQKLISKMNASGIYYKDHNNSIAWRIPLFEEQETAFDWVKNEYRELFKQANKDKAGNGNTAVRLMKRLFVENPDIRKDEVMGATEFYLKNTDPKFIRLSHYFIQKGIGVDKISDLATWIDKYRKYQDREKGRYSKSNTMQ